jgi:antitoxin (DNA-binding transcriptional repressor) of toxin-antitoxin stability system
VYTYSRSENMRFIAVRDFRASSASIWRDLPEEKEMVITNNGKPIALLAPITDKTLEDTLSAFRRAKAINAVKKMQEISISLGNDKLTLDDINGIIKDVREKIK